MLQFGQLGIGSNVDSSIPAKVEAMQPEELADMACGWRHTIAVTASGQVYSWGRGLKVNWGTETAQTRA